MPVFREVIDCSDIEAGTVLDTRCRRGLMKDLDPYLELFTDLSPYRHPCEAVVLVAGTRIDPVAAAAIDRPGAKVLLQPKRQKVLHMAAAEAEFLISGRHEHRRIEGHLWKPVIFARGDETIFCAQ